MKNIILIGPPGCGKGTQSKLLSQRLGFEHISTGDLIREEQKNGTAIGKLATKLIDNGNFLPDDIVTSLVKQRIIDSKNDAGFIFDGFPRTINQAKSLDEFLFNRHIPLSAVINIVVSDPVITERILKRAAIENRADDKLELIPTRLHNYKNKTALVLGYFQNRRNIVEVNGDKNLEEVYTDIEKSMA
jgi:adenylate kinase